MSKRYKDVTGLTTFPSPFEYGKLYGFLGRNGAEWRGKSTLINIMANRIFADQGEISIDGLQGKENMEIHEKLYCMSETDLYDSGLRVRELFKWSARFL